ncbi:MAG: hypothetical protein PHN64_02430 [Desulfovibrionaceae bacterium]|nr:hypothetical protein [Desulfovibrionaceae bacterium]
MGMDAVRDMESVCLQHDNGADLTFRGRLFSECSWFDEESGTLTRQKLYVTDSNEQVYYIVRGAGKQRVRSAYRVSVQGETCFIHNGSQEMALQFDMLMLAVRALCGLKDNEAMPSLENVAEIVKAANA